MQGLRAHCGEWMWGTPGALLASIRAPTLQGTRGAPGYSPFLGAGTPNPGPVGQHPVGWMWGDTGTIASPCSLSLARRTGVGIGQPQHWGTTRKHLGWHPRYSMSPATWEVPKSGQVVPMWPGDCQTVTACLKTRVSPKSRATALASAVLPC